MTEPAPSSRTSAKISSAKVSQVIVRACANCGGTRTLGAECMHCGNSVAAQTINLGVVSATYRNPIKRLWRHLVGGPLAKRRIKRANALTEHARGSQPRIEQERPNG